VAALVGALNNWPGIRAGFSTARPLPLQQAIAIVGPVIGILISAAGVGLLAGYVARSLRPPFRHSREAALLGVGSAAAVAGGLALAALLRESAAPPWPPLGVAGTF